MAERGIAFIADAHIRPLIWAHRSPVTGDAEFALEQVLAGMKARDIGTVCWLGDMADSPEIDGETGRLLRWATDEIRAMGIVQYSIQGNHDRSDTPIASMFKLEHINGRTVEQNGLRMHALDWAHAESARQALASVPECDLLLMHAPFRHLLSFDGKWQFEAADIPDHVGTVIVGDIHRQHRLSLPPSRAGRSREIISPGSLYPCKADEASVEHGYLVFDGMGFEHIGLECRCIIRHAGSAESLAELMEQVSLEHSTDRLRPVVMAPECPAELLKAHAGIVVVETGYAAVSEEAVESESNAYTLAEALEERFTRKEITAELKAAATRLLGSASPAKELELLLQESKVELQLR